MDPRWMLLGGLCLQFPVYRIYIPFSATPIWKAITEHKCKFFVWLVMCDRTTSKIRGLSPKIISGDSRQSENAQTHTNKHTILNMKFKLKLLQIKCRILGFTKVKAPKCASKELIRVLRKRLSLTIGTRSSP
jgi:hypothetical protein